eukprot:COSAG02_NODE_23564_length_715_cov_0.722403_2_plen_96_part_01
MNDTNIREVVSSCLDEAPVDGNCPSSAFGPIACWNVSAVQDMRRIFENATAFNGDVSAWNVSAVRHMSLMFSGATAFNGNLSAWDVSAVQRIGGMF